MAQGTRAEWAVPPLAWREGQAGDATSFAPLKIETNFPNLSNIA
jgi:hypothetical protein